MFLLVFFFTIITLVFGLTFQQKWKFRSLRSIPGPMEYPFVGNALEFGLNPVEILKDLTRLMKNHGNVTKVKVGPLKMHILIGDPDLTEFFLSSPKYITKSVDYNLLRPGIKNGLLTSTGSYWQKRRKVITPTFHFKILEEFVPIFNAGGDFLIKRLYQEVGKDVCDVYPYITAYTIDIICETAMGTTVKAQENPNNEYVQAVKTVCTIIIKRNFSFWKQFDALFQLSCDYKTQEENLKIVHGFTKSVIENRRKELMISSNCNSEENEDNDLGLKKKRVFLDLLLKSTIDGKPLTDDEISEEVNTFMIEGHDTTASAVCFALYELARNPEVQKTLAKEMKELFNNDKSLEPTLTDLNNMKYLELVIKETLRLYPSVPFYGRELQEDVTYKGTVFPKDTSLIFFAYYMQRNADLYKNPDQFYPERFAIYNSEKRNPFAYIPFSAGPRNCIGQKFAMYEMKSVLSNIIRHFELEPADPKYNVILSSEVVLKSANGIYIRLKKRN